MSRVYGDGQVWRNARGNRRVILDTPYTDLAGVVWLRVGTTYRDLGHMVTAAEMDAWIAKHNAKLREPAIAPTEV